VLDANRRYLTETQTFGGRDSAVTSKHSSHSVNHDGPKEPKALDAFCELINLSLTVHSRIPGVELQICNRNPSNDSGETGLPRG